MMLIFFFFNDTATTEIYTLSLHDALPISLPSPASAAAPCEGRPPPERSQAPVRHPTRGQARSEEHTSELQSQSNLVCRLLLEKKKKKEHRYENDISRRPLTQEPRHTRTHH